MFFLEENKRAQLIINDGILELINYCLFQSQSVRVVIKDTEGKFNLIIDIYSFDLDKKSKSITFGGQVMGINEEWYFTAFLDNVKCQNGHIIFSQTRRLVCSMIPAVEKVEQ